MPVHHSFYHEFFEGVLTLLPDLAHTARKRLVCLVFGILLAQPNTVQLRTIPA